MIIPYGLRSYIGLCLSKFSLKHAFKSANYNNFVNSRNLSAQNIALNISGIYPPITTPFDERGHVIYDKLTYNLEKWESVPFRGYVVLGSTGEFVSLNEEEKVSLVKHVKNSVSPTKVIIAGSGCESTYATIELTNKMADAGANAALVVSPFFYKGRMTEDSLYDHYIKIADSSKIPIILYSVPANTSIDLSASLVTKLAEHPNIIGIKDSGGDITKIGLIVHKTKGKDFQVLAGSAGFLYPGLRIGCVGGVLALANPLGKQLCQLYQYSSEGKHDEACTLHLKLIEPNLAVTKMYGIPGVKASMNLLGFHGGLCRLPLMPLSTQEIIKLQNIFKANEFL